MSDDGGRRERPQTIESEEKKQDETHMAQAREEEAKNMYSAYVLRTSTYVVMVDFACNGDPLVNDDDDGAGLIWVPCEFFGGSFAFFFGGKKSIKVLACACWVLGVGCWVLGQAAQPQTKTVTVTVTTTTVRLSICSKFDKKVIGHSDQ